jgi:hypothetical protein
MADFLAIYLRDQLALGVGWRELARRAQRNNDGTEMGDVLRAVADGIAEDVDTLRRIMDRLGIRADPVRTGLAILGERVGRLKPNGRLVSFSPLSRFEELELLTMGLAGTTQLWTTLRDLAGLEGRLPDVDLDELLARAEGQRAALEPLRVRAGVDAFQPTAG